VGQGILGLGRQWDWDSELPVRQQNVVNNIGKVVENSLNLNFKDSPKKEGTWI